MRMLALACALLVAILPAGSLRAQEGAWPVDGVGVDGVALVRQFRVGGFTPAQARHAARLFELFASPAAIDPALSGTWEARAWEACRLFGAQALARQSSLALLLQWEPGARQRLVEEALAAQSAAKLSSFVAGCGIEASEMERYLKEGSLRLDDAEWSWEDLGAAWPASGGHVRADIAALRAQTGLRWLRVSARQAQTVQQWRHLSRQLRQQDSALRGITGWRGPVLSLWGRVAVEVSPDAGSGLAGEMVYAQGALVLRGNTAELSHEWLHALDHALGRTPGAMASTRPGSPFADLLAQLRADLPGKDKESVHRQEQSRLDYYRRLLAPKATIDPLRTRFPSGRDLVEALKESGMAGRDALFLGQFAWQLQSSASASWTRHREAVAAAIVQGQSDGWIGADLGRAHAAYIASPAELLASHFSGTLRACGLRHPAHPLEMPTCAEARLRRAAWQRFFAGLPPRQSWPLPR